MTDLIGFLWRINWAYVLFWVDSLALWDYGPTKLSQVFSANPPAMLLDFSAEWISLISIEKSGAISTMSVFLSKTFEWTL